MARSGIIGGIVAALVIGGAAVGAAIWRPAMRAQALLRRNSKPTDAEIRAELAPHLCRCGTHMRILRAVRRAAQLMDTAELPPAMKGSVQ